MCQRSVVFVDSCVLYSAMLRDVLLRAAEIDLLRVRWSARVLQEVSGALARQRNIPEHKLARLHAHMNTAFPDALVDVPLMHIAGLPDSGDHHVVAAAYACDAQFVLTMNVRHFPESVLAPLSLAVIDPDSLFCGLLEKDPAGVIQAVSAAAESKMRPPMDAQEVLESLRVVAPRFAQRAIALSSRS